MEIVKSFFLVGVGGFLGASLRYGVTLVCVAYFSESLIGATLIVNILGSFAIGSFFELAKTVQALNGGLFLLCTTGLLGGFTTFSTFSLENFLYLKEGQYYLALGNISLNLVFCLAGVFLGSLFIRNLLL